LPPGVDHVDDGGLWLGTQLGRRPRSGRAPGPPPGPPACARGSWPARTPHNDTNGKPAIHDTTIYKVFARWAKDGSLWQACIASVRHLATEQHLDTRKKKWQGVDRLHRIFATQPLARSEERRVGKESRYQL